DTYEANLALGHGEDERDYTAAAQMLGALGADRVALLTNNPDKVDQLRRLGVTVTERVPTGVYLCPANAGYLAAKADRAARTLDLLTIGKGVDMGFYGVLRRPFDLVLGWRLLGDAVEVVRRSFGGAGAIGSVVAVGVLAVAGRVLMTLAVMRLTRLVVGHR